MLKSENRELRRVVGGQSSEVPERDLRETEVGDGEEKRVACWTARTPNYLVGEDDKIGSVTKE